MESKNVQVIVVIISYITTNIANFVSRLLKGDVRHPAEQLILHFMRTTLGITQTETRT